MGFPVLLVFLSAPAAGSRASPASAPQAQAWALSVLLQALVGIFAVNRHDLSEGEKRRLDPGFRTEMRVFVLD
jgi:hypothetical protein